MKVGEFYEVYEFDELYKLINLMSIFNETDCRFSQYLLMKKKPCKTKSLTKIKTDIVQNVYCI